MDPQTLVTAVESGDSDRVNDVIEDVEALTADQRMSLLEEGLSALTSAYDRVDGYGRQSVVRQLDALYSGVDVQDDGTRRSLDPDGEMAMRLGEFYLQSIRDDDGRVRKATTRAIQSLCIQCNLRDDEAIVEALADNLEELAATTDDPVRKHVEEAREHVERQMGPLGAELRMALDDALEAYDPDEWDPDVE